VLQSRTMAGTAEGIAKARAAREAKQRQREQPQQSPNSDEVVTVLQPVADLVDAAPTLLPAVGPSLSGNQTLATEHVSMGAAEGAQFLRKLVRNSKAGLRLRYEAACSLLGFAGFGQKGGAGSGQAAEDVALDRIAQALQLRARTLDAVDVTPESVKKS
jgi:hypothetical protein